MNSEKLAEILASHSLWVSSDEASGECADLEGADLEGADLQGADLQGANLRDANLVKTNLQGVFLLNADLRGVDLRGAYLRGAILECANLENANLGGVDFECANLENANLGGVNLQRANLRGADLRWANLRGANLRGAIFRGVNLDGAILPQNWQIVPRVGQSFTAFKRVIGGIVLELLIPGSAQRTSSLIGRKCRASEALVVGVAHGVAANNAGIYRSLHCSDFTYEIGKTAREPAFDPDVRIECTTGIHFFMTKEEAISYR